MVFVAEAAFGVTESFVAAAAVVVGFDPDVLVTEVFTVVVGVFDVVGFEAAVLL